MEKLVPVVNKLYDVLAVVGSRLNIDLPQIVVIGSQSVGKSSVLEAIVGKGFLPRGSGIVTRRPLVLQLIRTPGIEQDYAKFLHTGDKTFTDFEEVRKEIVAETDRLTGTNKGVSKVPISLRVYSRSVLDLTLVDLPGITRVPVGDQPSDIEQQIRNMCLEFIRQPNVIILAVTAANVDISTSDAIQLARSVDPQGQRTLAVLTKLDIMDRGTDAFDVLDGRVIPLRLGYVGVVCRGQHAIESKMPVEEALANEKRFFQSHPRYCQIADRLGTPYLTRRLNEIFLTHIKKTIPEIKQRVTSLLADARLQLASLPEYVEGSKSAVLLQQLSKYSDEFKEALVGVSSEEATDEKKLRGGAKLREVFDTKFCSEVDKIKLFRTMTRREILTIIDNSCGCTDSLFVPELAFETLVKQKIELLEDPSLECLREVTEEMKLLFKDIGDHCIVQFNNLRDAVYDASVQLLMHSFDNAQEMITDLLATERSFINCAHPEFIGGERAVDLAMERLEKKGLLRRVDRTVRQDSTQSVSPKLQAPEPEPERCFLCNEILPDSPAERNAHINSCIAKQTAAKEKVSKASATPAVPIKKKSRWSSWFGGGDEETKAEVEPAKPAEEPVQVREPSPVRAPSPVRVPSPVAAQPNVDESSSSSSSVISSGAVASVYAAGVAKDPNFRIELVCVLIESYFGIVRKNIKDLVAKTIMCFLINATAQEMHHHLLSTLFKEDNIDELLEESPEIATRRTIVRQNVEALEKAARVLSDIRDYSY